MSPRQYEYALASAEAGSVTAAAELLHVAQPSVSQQIRGLERELGVECSPAGRPDSCSPWSAARSCGRRRSR
ncbi:LysR family transcriptional regulator [Streptomyces sp. NBC_00401]|nr:LysR family transcriptional regulator [Streptomyces sp. NBC_00401]